ncbi:hypothetical protein [Streptomyces sp. NPDC059918]|uniref:hypothetical protein n=1 Tax=unclassified Streptomyces TaxID=2593676 RepID=UPI003666F1A3
MSSSARSALLAAAGLAMVAATATGCAQKSDGGSAGVLRVTASDSACEVSESDFPAGKVTIQVENKGSKVTELYVLFPDDRIVAEREDEVAGPARGESGLVAAVGHDCLPPSCCWAWTPMNGGGRSRPGPGDEHVGSDEVPPGAA